MAAIVRLSTVSIILLFRSVAPAADGTVYVGSTGAASLTVSNSGGLGGSQTVSLPVGASQKFKIWFSTPGFFFQRGPESACADPCTVSLNTELARIGRVYEITDSSGNSYSPPRVSSIEYLTLTPQAAETAPFTLPALVYGRGQTSRYSVAIANGVDVSALRLWVFTQNLRQGALSVYGNSGVEHKFQSALITDLTSNGSACTLTTAKPHGLSTNQVVDLSMFRDTIAGNNPGYDYSFNGLHTVASTPTATTFTVACSLASGHWNEGAAQSLGKAFSASIYAASEWSKWSGGLNGNHQAGEYMVPLGATEFTANATNTLTFQFNGQTAGDIQLYGLIHGVRVLDWALVQADKACTQIVVTGANAVMACAGHGYSTNDTVLIRDAPGPRWRFNGKRVITAATTNTFTFLWGPDSGAGSAPYTTANGTYAPPTTNLDSAAPQPVMYAARSLNAKTDFTQRDPANFATEFARFYGDTANNGATYYATGTLKDPNPYSGASNSSLATCSGCHMKNGVDLRKFAYEPPVVAAAILDRGGNETNFKGVSTWVATLTPSPPAKCRPWNPPYQSAPGLDALTIDEWQCGGGLEWVLTYDTDLKEYLCPSGNCDGDTSWAYNGSVNAREVPVPLQMPLMHHWWPEKHPADFYAETVGSDFSASALSTTYQSILSTLATPCALASGVNNSTTTLTFTAACGFSNNDYLKVDQEWVRCTSGAGSTTGTCSRGVTPCATCAASTAASHSSGVFLSDFTKLQPAGGGDGYMQQLMADLSGFNITYSATGLPGGGAAGHVNPSQYTVGFYGVTKWVNSRYFDVLTTYKLQDMIDVTTRAFYNVTPNARSATQNPRGWMTASVFCTGPHKCGGGGQYTYENVGPRSTVNFDFDTSVWYQQANPLNLNSRLDERAAAIDWQYTHAFNHGISTQRPYFYMQAIWMPFQIQNTMGFALPTGNNGTPGWEMALNSFLWGKSFNFRFVDLFVGETEKGQLVKRMSTLFSSVLASFSTANWQAFVTAPGGGSCPLATAVNATSGALDTTSCWQSHVAFGLPVMKYYGVDNTTLAAIKDWANAVWQSATSHDFQTDLDATCAFDASVPPLLKCTNAFP